ncbi:ArnT family glycosyltransferase [Candidatus Leptofilum sp.]|uniref:ArnT family glycosyltransferase n=1 Tax=Candidatus Leptofilum sp. TaxID=3241576 RepID=UPI003B598FD7
MKKWQERLGLGFILLVAAVFRFTGIAWDDYHHYHPDERYITWVATTIEWPADWQTAFSPNESSFNPFYWPANAESDGIEVLQDEPRDFAYGHVPLYLGVLATRIVEGVGPVLQPLFPDDWLFTRDILNEAELTEFRHLTAVSRALTALFDLGTVWILFLLGRRLFSPQVGLLGAAFLAVNVMHIQLSHFFISDPYQTFFTVAALLLLIKAISHREHREEKDKTENRSLTTVYWLLASVCIGLAVGSKFSAILLVFPLMLAARWMGSRWDYWLGTAVFTATLTFFLTNPFAVLDFSCEVITPATQVGPVSVPALDWGSCYVENIATQNSMVHGNGNIPFTRQYSGTLPYLYFIEMQLRWGMGWPLGLLAFGAFGWAIWQEIRRLKIRNWRLMIKNLQSRNRRLPISNLLLLAWAVPLFITTGGFFVKFMRYLQPLTPFLMLWAAAWLLSWQSKVLKWGVGTAVLTVTTLYAISFVNMYQQPHPWVAASEWIFREAEPGSLILSEQWDDSLPSTMVVDGDMRRRSEYPNAELTWLTGADSRDNAEKLAENVALLAEAEYVTILSNRVYGTVPRLPEQYPISSQYHELLFSGALGYEPVYVVGRTPTLFGWQLRADTFGWPDLQPPPLVQSYLEAQPGLNLGRADESFIVYDQPLTIIFENVERQTAEEIQSLFEFPME